MTFVGDEIRKRTEITIEVSSKSLNLPFPTGNLSIRHGRWISNEKLCIKE